jgi:hypothetical protein
MAWRRALAARAASARGLGARAGLGLCWWSGDRLILKHEKQHFFFEKKKQKTFDA